MVRPLRASQSHTCLSIDKHFLSTHHAAGSGLGVGGANRNRAEVFPLQGKRAKEMLSSHGGRAQAEEERIWPCTGRGRKDMILPPEIPAERPGRCLGFPP